jgi:6-pyruvoyltetrahydropterin/6-carboxytetrahydropterin synthase
MSSAENLRATGSTMVNAAAADLRNSKVIVGTDRLCIVRDIEFDAGHRVLGHESKCANLHGHRYKIECTVEAPRLDLLGRVIDFGCLKDIAGKWVDDVWDHNMLLHYQDPLLSSYDGMNGDTTTPEDICGRPPYIMKHKRNPTAENIAVEFFENVQPLLPPMIHIVQVVVHETPKCRAIYCPPQRMLPWASK